jgi:hypothetical protein
MLPKIFAKTIPGTKNFRENENFREILQKVSEFSLIFAKMKKGVFDSTLRITVDNRLVET